MDHLSATDHFELRNRASGLRSQALKQLVARCQHSLTSWLFLMRKRLRPAAAPLAR